MEEIEAAAAQVSAPSTRDFTCWKGPIEERRRPKASAESREEVEVAKEEKSAPAEPALDDVAYEKLIDELDGVVRQLEASELTLEESLVAFERGVKLAKAAEDRLDRAEQRVEVLLQGDRRQPLPAQEGAESARGPIRARGEPEDVPF